jgi:hypothetical protein
MTADKQKRVVKWIRENPEKTLEIMRACCDPLQYIEAIVSEGR